VAVTQYSRRQWTRAERSYRQASRIVSEAANPELVGVALNGVAGARLGRGDLAGAREMLLRSLRLKERGGNQHQIAVAYSNLAEVELRLKDVPAALEHARRSVRLGERVRAGSDLADMYKNLAEAALAQGELGTALDSGSRALAVAEAAGRVYLGEVAVTLAKVCARIAGEPSVDASARERATDAAAALRAILANHSGDDDLRAAIEACNSILSPVTLS
jgi:tetratricopeptide (TPR) repeat protein